MTAVNNAPPDFTRGEELRPVYQEIYERYYDWTSPENIQSYASGASLENLAKLAIQCQVVIEFGSCPISGTSDADVLNQRQWKVNQLSDVKQRLAQAIVCKRSYYDNHPFGIITKYVLKFLDQFGFKLWNNGDTAAIVAAEDFLLMWDSRLPVIRRTYNDLYGEYAGFSPRGFGATDLSRYYNYTTQRIIPISHAPRHTATQAAAYIQERPLSSDERGIRDQGYSINYTLIRA